MGGEIVPDDANRMFGFDRFGENVKTVPPFMFMAASNCPKPSCNTRAIRRRSSTGLPDCPGEKNSVTEMQALVGPDTEYCLSWAVA